MWKRILASLLLDYYSVFRDLGEKRSKSNKRQRIAAFYENFYLPQSHPETPKLVYVLNGAEYADVADFPDGIDIVVGLGCFDLSQPVIRVSDPCYEKGARGAATVKAVPGKWRAHASISEGFGYAVARLTVAHESLEGIPNYSMFEAEPICYAGVDSGQCGFFDEALYPSKQAEFEYKRETFYGKACAVLTPPNGEDLECPAAVIPDGFGVVSRTFYGDGSYACRVMRNAEGKVIAAYLWYAPKADPFFPSDEASD